MTNTSDDSQYAQSGVSGQGAEDALQGLVRHILPTRTLNPAYPCKIDSAHYANVVDFGQGQGVAFCTDGVGTKIIVAEMLGRYDTIGIDCIAMNVNDVICVGARPVSMVDYIACSHTDPNIFSALGEGLAEGARQSGISIVGGEISQIREIIQGIDLIGACIGHVAIDKINTGKNVRPGNIIIGLASSGIHSNGLTLARKVLLGETIDQQKNKINEFSHDLNRSLGEELLEPTRIYVEPVMEMLEADIRIQGLAHITGGGMGNLLRMEAENIRMVLDRFPEDIPPVFSLIQDYGEIEDAEMFEVFNMGVGFCLMVENASDAESVLAIAKKHQVPAEAIGFVEACQGKEVTLPKQGLVCRDKKFIPV